MSLNLMIQIFSHVLGGLGLFLLGMKQMSDGMQSVAGDRMRALVHAVTDNRITACGVGVLITGLVQSSSITTVMVVGMVNAGIMVLRQAIGVIMGTNIGTTVTAWLVALHVADYGLPILGLAAIVFLFAKNEKLQYSAMVFLGLGMVFFGLELMKDGLNPLKDLPHFMILMAAFEPTTLWGLIKCVFVGAMLTAIIQSSSATVALTITLATTQTITFETAAALVLGENIGTTITAFLSSIGTNTSAKRAAYAHILFNIIGVSVMIPVFKTYLWFLDELFPSSLAIASRIAFSHSFFNIAIVCLLLPLLDPYTRLIEKIIPAKKTKEKRHLTYLDVRLFETPSLALEQSYREILQMGEGTSKMMNWLKDSFNASANNKSLENKLFHREKIFDIVQKEIVEFISKMMTGTLSHDTTSEARKQLRMADEYESISDYIITLLKLRCRMRNNDIKFAKTGYEEMMTLHQAVDEYLHLIFKTLQSRKGEEFSKILSNGEQVTHLAKDIRNRHLNRLSKKEVTPLGSLIFMDMLSAYRRIKDHALNIAEAMVGEK